LQIENTDHTNRVPIIKLELTRWVYYKPRNPVQALR
jgi:hypothetical protein